MSKTLYLVACAKTKGTEATQAQHLYTSPLFRKSREWVLSRLREGDEWLILSAKHGALTPDQIIEPYELSLPEMTSAERGQWAYQVWLSTLQPMLTVGQYRFDQVVFLAGRCYWRDLVWHMNRWMERNPSLYSWDVVNLLGDKGIGERLQWLTREVSL